MYALIVSMLLTAGASGSGAAQSGGRVRTPGNMGANFAGAAVGEARATLQAVRAGELVSINMDSITAGSDGAGSTFDLTLGYHDGDGLHALCTLTAACTQLGNTSGTCSGTFDAGEDLHFYVSSSGCAALPGFVGAAEWSW